MTKTQAKKPLPSPGGTNFSPPDRPGLVLECRSNVVSNNRFYWWILVEAN